MIDKIQNKLKERLQYHKGIADDLEKNPGRYEFYVGYERGVELKDYIQHHRDCQKLYNEMYNKSENFEKLEDKLYG